jgi:L-fuculose-phosphate aldolase
MKILSENSISTTPELRETIRGIVHRAVSECIFQVRAANPGAIEPLELFHSPEALAVKEEIVRVGKKLWDREYVDGNGGNISYRISSQYVLCTPTLCSKGDLKVEDICLVDLNNNLIIGIRPQTSELKLHFSIYKSVPKAKAVVHCHPPYATAHAVAGVAPPLNLIPEQEVFVGPVALSPYETPGTQAFADTVLPYAKKHNTILLKNHGIVCWADTVTHAEWFVEVVDTYCKTVMIARQLNPNLPQIPPDKVQDLLDIKKKLGLPDARLPEEDDVAEAIGTTVASVAKLLPQMREAEVDELISFITEKVLAAFDRSK